jgi:hypothetical protein
VAFSNPPSDALINWVCPIAIAEKQININEKNSRIGRSKCEMGENGLLFFWALGNAAFMVFCFLAAKLPLWDNGQLRSDLGGQP